MSDSVIIHPATPARWTDVVDVFGGRGDPAWCWCHFHSTTDLLTESAADYQAALREQLHRRPAPGVLAYRDDRPVGWARVGPADRFARIVSDPQRTSLVSTPADLWVVACFVVPPGHRRQGISAALLAGAIAFARRHRAVVLEGHPVDTRGEKAPSATLYQGVLSTFLAAGFAEVARTSPKRPIVRLPLA